MTHPFGIFLALASAVGHTSMDMLRKLATSSKLTSTQIVCFVSVGDSLICGIGLWLAGVLPEFHLWNNAPLVAAAAGSAAIRVSSIIMYQYAILVSPLSATVPYLAFSPAFIIINAFFVMDEVPSYQGIVGVLVVAIGGFALGTVDGSAVPPRKPRGGLEPIGSLLAPAGEGVHMRNVMEKKDSSRLLTDEESVGPDTPSSSRSDHDKKKARPFGGLSMRLIAQYLPRMEKGSVVMLAVALMWAWSTTLDRLGIIRAPGFLQYLALQRFFTGLPTLLMMLVIRETRQRIFGMTRRDFLVLTSMSFAEIATVVLHFWSFDYMLLSYAVSAKRAGILFSVLGGALFFKENIWMRMPYIMTMMVGMMLIIFAPDHVPQVIESETTE